jgi:transcriptional regulator with XRE-family HTH domain
MVTRPPHSFGDLLRTYRTAAGLTQEGLAARAGMSTRGISDLERGVRQMPYRGTIELLAEALQLTPPSASLSSRQQATGADLPSPLGMPQRHPVARALLWWAAGTN